MADKEYGSENSGYVRAMFLTAWKTIIGAKVVAKLLNMPAGELAVSVAAIRRRFAKVKEILRTTI